MKKWQKSKRFVGVYKRDFTDKDDLKDTSYYITYKIDGKTQNESVGKKSTGMNELLAHQKRAEIMLKITNGETVKAKRDKINKISLNYLANKYFTDKAPFLRNIKREQGKYNKEILNTIGNYSLHTLSIELIRDFQQSLVKQNLAPKTVNNYISLCKTIVNYAIKQNLIDINNPFNKIDLLQVDNKRQAYLSKEDCKNLLESVQDNKILKMFVLMSLSTGARLESILSITKKDINIRAKTVLLKDMKGNETYTGFIATNLYNELIEHIDKLNINDYIVGCSNTKVTSIYIHRHLKPILDKLFNIGLEKDDRQQRVVIHTLRHTFASLLVINGTPIVTVKKLMNHKDIKTTMIYAHLAPESGRADVEGLF